MKILALIPARGGSKRLPGKNIRPLGGKPLIIWSIDAVKNIPEICNILVSTDDASIAQVSREAGASVPWLRPVELATDTSSSADVAIHALDWYEAKQGCVDGLLLIQPTSPFRSRESIKFGIELFSKHNYQPVLGVSPTSIHPMTTFKKIDNYLVPYMAGDTFKDQPEVLLPLYIANGTFYLISPKNLRKYRSFIGPKTISLLARSPEEAIDIDTFWDFKLAEFIASKINEY